MDDENVFKLCAKAEGEKTDKGKAKIDLTDQAKQKRIENNKRLSDMVKNGEKIPTSFTSQNSWYPPRPVIKKDAKAVKKLYGRDIKPI